MNSNLARQPCVYGLRAGSVFGYVGMTRVNMKTRLWEHRSRARSGHTAPVYDWMRSVGVDSVEIVELSNNPAEEVLIISNLLADGHPLANQTSRDGVANSMSAAARARIGDAKRGRQTWIKGKTGEAAGWTDERREAASEAMKRRMSR